MAPQEFAQTSGSDLTEDINDHEAMFSKRGCCFLLPCLGSSSSAQSSDSRSVWWQRMRTTDKFEPNERWYLTGWRKVREWSELVAGPKWKTFIRRISRNPNCCCAGGFVSRNEYKKYQYDPESYALNFDEGVSSDAGLLNRDFSSRFAVPPLPQSINGSMDLGKNGTIFT